MYAKPSPDGKYIAYVDWETGNLAIRDTKTGTSRLLTKDGSWGDTSSFSGLCAWSHDSKRIAFSWEVHSPKERRTELRVVSLKGDSECKIITLPDAAIPYWIHDWSPDNSRVLCSIMGKSRKVEDVFIEVKNNIINRLNPDVILEGCFLVLFANEEDTILFSRPSDGMGTSNDIYLADLKTGKTSAIIEHPAEDLLVGMLPGTDWLLFVSNRRGRLDLWGIPFRKGMKKAVPVLIKQGIGRFFPLGFTSDGKYYYATLSVTDDVFFVDFDPETKGIVGIPRKLKSPWEGANMGLRFSQNGRRTAYVTNLSPLPIPTHSANTLVVQSLEDEKDDPVIISFNEFHLSRVAGPRWEAGDESIVLAGFQGDEKGLYRVDLMSLKKEKTYSAPEGHNIMDHESDDESGRIYLILIDEERTGSIVSIDPDGGKERQLFQAPPGQLITGMSFSPDHERLSFLIHLDTYKRAIVSMSSEGEAPNCLHEFSQPSGGMVSHTWTPDGESILYIIKEPEKWTWGLRLIPADGSDASKLVMKYTNPLYGLDFHPNGRTHTFTARNGASSDAEVWVMENLREQVMRLASKAENR